jgi:hypothetical protein
MGAKFRRLCACNTDQSRSPSESFHSPACFFGDKPRANHCQRASYHHCLGSSDSQSADPVGRATGQRDRPGGRRIARGDQLEWSDGRRDRRRRSGSLHRRQLCRRRAATTDFRVDPVGHRKVYGHIHARDGCRVAAGDIFRPSRFQPVHRVTRYYLFTAISNIPGKYFFGLNLRYIRVRRTLIWRTCDADSRYWLYLCRTVC